MSKLVPIGLGAAAVIAVLFLGSQFIGSPSSNLGGPAVGASPTPQPSEAAQSLQPTSAADGSLSVGRQTIVDEGSPNSILVPTVTIPSTGWTEAPDSGVISKGDDVANLPEATILFIPYEAGTGFYVYGDPCRWLSTAPETPATTVDEIVAALAAQASRAASEPVDVTVGGYAGKAIILHVPDDANFDDCEGQTFATFGTAPDELHRYQQGPGQIDELWILDADGAIVIIDAMYRPDTPTELIEELRAIAESATFERP